MATISDQEGLASGRQEGSLSTAGWLPANPAPLGLMGFGLTTLVLSFVNANVIGGGPGTFPIVLGMAIAFGGFAQLLAGMWEFRTGNTFGAVAFTSFGAFWISFYFLVSYNVAELPKTEVAAALGLYLWMWGIFTALLFLCTFASPRALQLLFLLLAVTFILLGIGNSGSHNSIIHAGGYVGIATGAVALYIATADIMQAVYKRSVLPVG
ncbi:MAG TPA: acetate uptake transporter [Solirubrobacteraceae bacterium]|nr:acetate uptake transporter [Solirubrobacteraceae bacterium]